MTDEELIAWVRNGFGNVAADRIEALVKEGAEWATMCIDYHNKWVADKARAERLEAALKGLMMHEPDHPDTLWQEARAALKGAEHE